MTTDRDDPWERAPAAQLAGTKRVLNVPADVFDARDLVYQPRPAPLGPNMVRPGTRVRDQQSEGTCTGCALATVVDVQLLRRADGVPVSARFLYENAKKYDEWKGEEYEGSSIRGAMKGLWYHGVCAEDDLPYRVGERWERLPRAAFANAEVRPLGAYYRVPTSEIPALQGAIAEAGAVLASAQVHEGWNEPVLRDGDPVAEIDWRKQPAQGGHAFALVGFDARGFLVQNSWGAGWGTQGCARLIYEDWLANRQDAWVAQVGLGRAALLRPEQRTIVTVEGELVARVREEDIEGHYLSIRNGRWETRGELRSFASDLPALIERIRQFGSARGLPKIPVLLYGHGGLVSAQAAAEKTLDFKEVMKANGIYPVHVIWRTGFLDEVADLVLRRGPERVAPQTSWFSEISDDAIEALVRAPGKTLWRLMREDAAIAVRGPRLDGSGPVAAFVAALQASGLPFELHLLGHSAGSLLHAETAAWCGGAGVPIASMAYLAPAITTARFLTDVVPLVESLDVRRFALWTMLDGDERDDHCARLYRKSLLYLVSQAFEPDVNTRLLGLARHIDRDWQGKDDDADPHLALWLRKREVVRWCRPRAVESTLHSSYDDDPAAVNAWLAWALERAPTQPYVRRRK